MGLNISDTNGVAAFCKLSLIVPDIVTPDVVQSASVVIIGNVLSPRSYVTSMLMSLLGGTSSGNVFDGESDKLGTIVVLPEASVMFTEPMFTVLEPLARGPSTKRS